MTHDQLVARAKHWLLNTYGCGFAFAELTACTNSGEIPDAIGFKYGHSILVECKTSRSDFLSDKKKTFRKYAWESLVKEKLKVYKKVKQQGG